MKTAFRLNLIALLLVFALPAVVRAQFDYTIADGQVTISQYTGAGGAVTIPETFNGLSVTTIGDWFVEGPSLQTAADWPLADRAATP